MLSVRHPILHPILRATLCSLALLTVAFSAGQARGVVNDAHSYAMEAASPDVEHGFTVRDDFWSGVLKSGARELIRHQLFKGNQYAFWLGVDTDGECQLEINIYDIKGKRIDIPSTSDGQKAFIHFAPEKTGAYFIVVTVKSGGADIPWALAYGYK